MTLIFYSAPHDLFDDLASLFDAFGARKAAVCKEITKLHEGAERITLGDTLAAQEPKGEYVIVVEGGETEESELLALSVEDHIKHYMKSGMDKKEAMKAVAKDRNISKSEVYKYSVGIENN